jgi:hypothetical protein
MGGRIVVVLLAVAVMALGIGDRSAAIGLFVIAFLIGGIYYVITDAAERGVSSSRVTIAILVMIFLTPIGGFLLWPLIRARSRPGPRLSVRLGIAPPDRPDSERRR